MRRPSRKVVLLAAAVSFCAWRPAFAIRSQAQDSQDIQRFELNSLFPVQKPAAYSSLRAFDAFNQSNKWQWRARFSARNGSVSSLTGGRMASVAGGPRAAAFAFLSGNAALLGVNPNSLALENQITAAGVTHLLFSQVYNGVPVEFARVKMDIDSSGSVLSYHSSYEPSLSLSVAPAVPESQAAQTALADAGGQAKAQAGVLVVWPNRQTGGDNLAWRVPIQTASALWRYYIDANSGAILFRYDDERSAGEAGTINGVVYAVDPNSTPPSVQPFPHERVCVGSAANCTLTDSSGNYSFTSALGEIFTTLQGAYVSVSNFQGPNANYENEGASWQVVSTPLSSPHPYAPYSISFATLSVAGVAPSAVEFLPIFSDLNVGITNTSAYGTGGEISGIVQDDRLTAFDSFGNPIAGYVGTFPTSFEGTAGVGQSMVLEINAAGGGSGDYGYDVVTSSCLVLSNPGTSGNDSMTWWPSSYTYNGMHSEIGLYYHLNLMHDYFANTMSALNVSGITLKPAMAMALVNNLSDAFYDPTHDDMSFGDYEDDAPADWFADDATVPDHEYTHYMTQKIWDIQNFGQAGAISEANADYNSASSLNGNSGDPNIGYYLLSQLGYSYPLRELDDNTSKWGNCPGAGSASSPGCAACSEGPHCAVLTSGTSNDWTGEIHTDSVFLSQALWDIRKNLVSLSSSYGAACANQLEFSALLYFPESFDEFYDALNNSAQNAASLPACVSAGANTADLQGYVSNAFSAHGLIVSPDEQGFETAVDVSTTPNVQGSIAAAGQTNFYSFGAGPGPMEISLTLPASPDGQGYYSAYGITLFDENHNVVEDVQPNLNGVGTGFAGGVGVCSSVDCTTTQQQVVLSYTNPSANHFYIRIAGSPTGSDSNSGVNNTLPYTLSLSYSMAGALSGQIVNASFDNDLINFSVAAPDMGGSPSYNFAYAQLRDQSQNVLACTQTNQTPSCPAYYLGFVAGSTQNVSGTMTGQVQIQPGFAARYPSIGSVSVEVFGTDDLGDTVSLGLSNLLNLGANETSLQAWNNVFNPLEGQQTTIKYQLQSAGNVSLKIYTMSGMLVDTLLDSDEPAGQGSIDWNGRNMRGSVVASGVYLVHIIGPGISKTQKVVVVK